MVVPTPNAGLFSRLVRRLSIWLQPRTPRQWTHFSRYRQCSAWFRPRREVSAQASEMRAKRQDLVRRREFEHLRSLRASAVWPPSGMGAVSAAVVQALSKPAPAPAPELSAMERAQTLQKIDAIESLMSIMSTQASDDGVNRPAGFGPVPVNPRAVSPSEGEGEDDGCTRIASASDLDPAKPPKPESA